MRVLVLTNLYPPDVIGGYELACANVAKELALRGHDVYLLTSLSHQAMASDTPYWVHRSLELHWYYRHISVNAAIREQVIHTAFCSCYANTMHLLKKLYSVQPDVVYVWNVVGIGGIALLDLLNCVGIPWVMHLMDRVPVELESHVPWQVRGVFNALGPALYQNARILSMSEHLLEEITSLSDVTFTGSVRLVPGWADLSAALPHQPYLRDGVARFVTAGNVSASKGTDLILEACARLRSEGIRFRVDVYGSGEIAKYSAMADALGLRDHVRFLGPRDQHQLLQLYSGYDAFLFPTWEREPFGFAPIEAAGCETPPIITSNCGAAERIVDNFHCIKIERTADQLADAMRRAALGAIDLARLGRAGRRLVLTDLSFERAIIKIETALATHAAASRLNMPAKEGLALLSFLKHNLSVKLRFG